MPKVGMPAIRKPQLIDATLQAINDVGLQKASVALISSYAGVSPAIINHYFGGKDELLEATMRSILRQLSKGIEQRLAKCDSQDVIQRITAIVAGNFSAEQIDTRIVKTWLSFWSQSMHHPKLYRLQRVNEKRLMSHLVIELKKVLPADKAKFIALSIAALIDGIWLRGSLSAKGIDGELAQRIIADFLEKQLPQASLELHQQRQLLKKS